MRRNNEKVSVYNTGRGITSQTLIYQHMSNHYRRILNAKKAVDTAPPTTFKPKRNSTSSTSSPVRNSTATNKNYNIRNVSPALTERTVSTCSNGGSYWGTESYFLRKCQNSGNERCQCRTRSDINPNTSDMELITQIAFDTKSGPSNCFETDWKTNGSRGNLNNLRSPYQTKKTLTRSSASEIVKKTCANKSKLSAVKRKLSQKDRAPSDLMETHSKCFIPHNSSFRPRILKTNATSKLRTLRVYHPPKKKNGIGMKSDEKETKKSMEQVNSSKSENRDVSPVSQNRKCTTCKCNKPVNARETSQTSSRDSAYNGGVSSLPESRSPTPDQKKQSGCCCHRKVLDTYYDDENIIVPNLKLTDNQNTQTELIEISDEKNSKNEITNCCRSKNRERCSSSKDSLGVEDRDYFTRKIKEEALYTNFIRDITAEVLDKGLFTNKALKKVMKKHLLSNLWILDKTRMMNEIDKLRIQLGIPEDEDLMNINVGSNGSVADMDENFPVVSDSDPSESVFQTNGKSRKFMRNDTSTSNRPDGSDSEKLLPKSISDVLYQAENNELILETDSDDEDEDLISVIHVTKLVKDKKRNDSSAKGLSSDTSGNCTRGNSADESDQSKSDRVSRRKKVHSRFRKTEKASSSSDEHSFSKIIADNRKHPRGKLDCSKDGKILSSPQRKGVSSKRKDKEKEVGKSGE